MNIAIIGYGKMGKMMEKTALEKGHHICAVVEPMISETATLLGTGIYKSIESAENLEEADAAIEFTRPDTAAANILALAKLKIPSVIGTTGWHERLAELTAAVNAEGSSLLWASNFSLGINLFYRISWYAAQLADSFPEYDVGGYEIHHNKKADSPSGTAKTLVEGVLKRMKRKQKPVWDTLDRPPAQDELHYPSLRVGTEPGTHALIFDSAADTITLTHTARNREGFAAGALLAAEWLVSGPGKKHGVFTMDDMLTEILKI
jgi:4-hydroxy-tetrahydrodipicolinate reductase